MTLLYIFIQFIRTWLLQDELISHLNNIQNIPDYEINIAHYRLLTEKMIDPSINIDQLLIEIESITEAIQVIALIENKPPNISHIRTFFYTPGWWNQYQPYQYNHSQTSYYQTKHAFLSQLLITKKGDCTSLPLLITIIATSLNLPTYFTTLPDHNVIQFESNHGPIIFETTSNQLFYPDQFLTKFYPSLPKKSLHNNIKNNSNTRIVGDSLNTYLIYLISKKQYKQATSIANIMVKLSPNNPIGWNNLNLISIKQKATKQ